MEIFSRAQEQVAGPDGTRKSRWAIIRNSYGELRSTTQKTWLDWFPPSHFGDIRRGSGPDTHFLKYNDVELEVLFLALDRPDDSRKLLSLEISGAWINEAREVAQEIIMSAMGRVGRYPSKRDGGCLHPCVILDSNPPNTQHWWYKLFEIDKPDNMAIFKQPSGLSPEAENLENLPDNYYQNMMAGMDELSIRAHVHGEYSFLRSGKPVYPSFKHSQHVATQELKPIPLQPITVGIDVGRFPAAVFLQQTYSGQVMVLSEIVGEDISGQTLADLIKQHVNQRYLHLPMEYFADPAFTHRSQTTDDSVSDVLFAAGLTVFGASSNSVEVRIDSVRNLLSKLDTGGNPKLLIDPRCERLIEAMTGGYHYKVEAVSGGRVAEKPNKNEHSHVADALQYGILGMGLDSRFENIGQLHRKPKVTGITARDSGHRRVGWRLEP